jgi:opacity protein-like surface antigen
MMKKTWLIPAILAVNTGVAIAGDMGSMTMAEKYTFKAGPYLGASTGIRVQFSGSPYTYYGQEFILSGGYGHLWNQRYYLAGEVFGSDSVRLKNVGPQFSPINNVRTTWSYGVDALPGIMLNDHTLGYLRVGYARTELDIKTSSNFPNTRSDYVYKTQVNGLRLGLGMQTNIYKNLDLRGEFVFTQYGHLNIHSYTTSGFNSFNLTDRTHAMQGNIGLVYKFV